MPEEREESFLVAATLMSAVAAMAADSLVGNWNTVDEKTGKSLPHGRNQFEAVEKLGGPGSTGSAVVVLPGSG